jgi:uncharacterized protein involved in exopolysaccharide biosynthesis
MPDIISVIARRWKLLFLLTFLATAVALIVVMLSPKLYLSTATALPANSVLNDKARIFNTNIEGLYPSLGSPDELDRIEGTTKLDTIFIAIANDFGLAAHYSISGKDAMYKAALKLQKRSNISRSAYGELKIKVWDKNNTLSAALANSFLQKLNEFHQHIQNANNAMILQKIKDDLTAKQKELTSFQKTQMSIETGKPIFNRNNTINDTFERITLNPEAPFLYIKKNALTDEIKADQNLISQYELSLKTSPDVLIIVERARPSLKPDKPNVLRSLFFAFIASLLFSFLLTLFVESRNKLV